MASMVLVSLNTARIKARDSKRLQDLNQVRLAMELYYSNHDYYLGDIVDGWEQLCRTNPGDMQTLVAEGLLPAVPCDPLNSGSNGDGYGYYFDSEPLPGVTPSQGAEYCLYANLETSGRYTVGSGSTWAGCL